MAWEPWDDPYTKFAYDPDYPYKKLNALVASLPDPDEQERQELLLEKERMAIEEDRRKVDFRTQLEKEMAGLSPEEALPLAQKRLLEAGEIGQFTNIGNYLEGIEGKKEAREKSRMQKQLQTDLTNALRGLPPEQALSKAGEVYSTYGQVDPLMDILKFQETQRAANLRESRAGDGTGKPKDFELGYFENPAGGKPIPLDLNNPEHARRILEQGLQEAKPPKEMTELEKFYKDQNIQLAKDRLAETKRSNLEKEVDRDKPKDPRVSNPKLEYFIDPENPTDRGIPLNINNPEDLKLIKENGLQRVPKQNQTAQTFKELMDESEEGSSDAGSSAGGSGYLDIMDMVATGLLPGYDSVLNPYKRSSSKPEIKKPEPVRKVVKLKPKGIEQQ